METGPTQVRMHEVVRYPKADRDQALFGSIRNLFTVSAGGEKAISLESGINPIRRSSVSGLRPAILLSSSPWKAGTESTPWHDVFDLDRGHVRYFGDHKASTTAPLGKTPGNAALLEEFAHHRGGTTVERRQATPLLLFRAVSHGGVQKGFREFCGVGVLETAERVVQWDAATGRSYTNHVFDIAVLDLGREEELLDWSWINERRVHPSTAEASLTSAPQSWRTWVLEGHGALPSIRRRVSRSRIVKRRQQLPAAGSAEEKALDQIYTAFADDKHAFESLASRVVGRILQEGASRYHPGWITRAAGDNGIDFVSRLDLGSGLAQVKLVVLGQAKCISPTTSISAGDLARVVARLRRGWIGAYVTTGTFTDFAQQEMVDDEYPILLVDGLRLARETRLLAAQSHGGDLSALLSTVLTGHATSVVHRRPEEILTIDGVTTLS